MGEVWEATRGDGLYAGRAAVKLLRVTPREPALAAMIDARFAREGELLARLAHPHIAQLLDAGVLADGTRYLVLEYVAGERIDRWCDARRLDIAARLALLLQVCEAVAFAHAHLIVHRDLKPSNLLVTEAGHAKLLDFGVAKLLDGGASDELTRLGAAGLTPEYAAPEQLSGAPVTVATDVYALGVLMFVLLAGQRPHGATGESSMQVARAIVENEPRRLGTDPSDIERIAAARSTTPARLRQQLRGDLEHIVAKALRKHPEDRYASAQALADDIGRYLRHESVSAQAPTWHYLAAKFVQRHRVGVAAGTLVAIASIAGVAATLWQAGKAREQAALARAEAANATAIKDYLLGVFNLAAVGDGKTRQDTTARELLQQGGTRLLADKQLSPAVRLELLGVVGSLQSNLGLTDAADPLQREALTLARDVYGPRSEKYVYALVERGLSLTQLGRPQESDAMTREAVTIIEATGQQSGESYPVALYQLGFNALQAGDVTAGVGYLQRASAAFATYRPREAMRSIAERWLGNAHARLDDFGAAEADLKRSIAQAGEQTQMRDLGIALGHYSLGDLYLRAGRFAAARTELTQALALIETTLGARHRSAALAHIDLARAQHQLGQADAAQASLTTAQDIAASDSSRQIGNAIDRVNLALAQVALDQGRSDEAIQRFGRAAARWQPQGGSNWALVLVSLAEAQAAGSRFDAALATLQQALPLLDAQLGAGSLASRQARTVLGEVHERRGGANDQALIAYTAALAGAADYAKAASPTREWLRARATLGLARLATDPARAARLAAEARALIPTPAESLRERRLIDEAGRLAR